MFLDIEAIYYEYCYDDYVTNKTYNTKCFEHFESVGSSCNVQDYHADNHAYAVEKQIV